MAVTVPFRSRGDTPRMIGSRLPELMLIHDLEGGLSAGICSYCRDVIAEADPKLRNSKSVVMDFAVVFQAHVQTKHPEIGLDQMTAEISNER
jgi:hypothetical protein